MKHLLIVYHSGGGKTGRMAEAVCAGAARETGVETRLQHAFDSGLDDLLWADGLIFGTPENFGYMSGALKDFFDRTFYPAEPLQLNLPYGLFVGAGNDGSGAVREVERIARGYPLRQVAEPVVAVGALTDAHLRACEELGEAMAAGLAFGIFFDPHVLLRRQSDVTAALILSGGGARAAYQVGVLHAVARLLPEETINPFPIICGTSAGAINALALAAHPGRLRQRVAGLLRIWRDLQPHQVYRTDWLGVLRNSLGLAGSLFWGGYVPCASIALLDNAPLRALLEQHIRFQHLDPAIARGELAAVCVTAMHYDSGHSVSFFQGTQPGWSRSRRRGERTALTIEHLLASAAIPILFPAMRIGSSYYGDGALRQLRPLSPALRLGADRLFVIGVSDNLRHPNRHTRTSHPPSVGQILGHMLNAAFIDSIESEVEMLETLNLLAHRVGEPVARDGGTLRPVKALFIAPSEPLDRIAAERVHCLPRTLRLFLRAIGATREGSGASAASYLLFEPGFCRRLLALGYADAMAQRQQILEFFRCPDADAGAITAADTP